MPATAAQSREALALANRVRFARKEAKRRVHARELSVADALVLPELANVLVWEVVGWQYRFGSGHAGGVENATRRLFADCGVAEWTRCGRLTVRQRAAISDALSSLVEPETK